MVVSVRNGLWFGVWQERLDKGVSKIVGEKFRCCFWSGGRVLVSVCFGDCQRNKNKTSRCATRMPRNCDKPSCASSIRRRRCNREKALICWCELCARVRSGCVESGCDCNHLSRDAEQTSVARACAHTSSRIVPHVVGRYTAASPRWCAIVNQSDQTCFHADPSTPRGPLR